MARKTTDIQAAKAGPDVITERLHDAIDGLRKDVTRVEIWATALGSFSRPVPDYSPSREFEWGNGEGRPSRAERLPSGTVKSDD